MADNAKSLKLERLLSELADEGATADLYEQIEGLLIDRPDLQSYYCRWMDTHVLLGIDKGSLVPKGLPAGRDDDGGGAPTGAIPKIEVASRHDHGARTSRWLVAFAAAASVALAVFGSRFLADGRFATTAGGDLAGETYAAPEPFSCRIPLITRVSHQGPFFLDGNGSDQAVQVSGPGNVSIKMVSGRSVEGYLLELHPGESVDILVASDACDRNAVSVTELDSSGAPLRSVVAFENYSTSDNDRRMEPRVNGLLGTWSTHNRTDRPQYYLFTGIYRVAPSKLKEPVDEKSAWQLSDSLKIIDGRGVVLLGWEDYNGMPRSPDDPKQFDHDYDDTYALLRVTGGSDGPPLHEGLKVFSSMGRSGSAPSSDRKHKYSFKLPPGECAVMTVTRDAMNPNSLYIVDSATQSVLWASRSYDDEQGCLGGIYFENNGPDAVELELIGESAPIDSDPEKGPWSSSRFEITSEYSGGFVVGFDDGADDGDFNDLRAVILSAPKIHNPPIDSAF